MKKTILLLWISAAWLTAKAQKPELVLPIIHSSPISDMSFSANGNYLASVTYDGEIKLWEAKTGRLIRTINSNTCTNYINLSADGTRLAGYCGQIEYLEGGGPTEYAETYNDIYIWNMETGEKINTIKVSGKPGEISQVLLSPDMRYVFVQHHGLSSVWEINTKQLKWETEGESGASFSFDGTHLLLSHKKWVDWKDNMPIETILDCECLASHCTKEFVVALDTGGVIKRWDIADKKKEPEHKLKIESIGWETPVFSSDGTKLFLGYESRNIYDASTGNPSSPDVPTSVQDSVYDVYINPSMSWIAPDLSQFVTAHTPDVGDIGSNMTAYNLETRQISHEFGLSMLEQAKWNNYIAEMSGVAPPQIFNQGKIIFYNRNEKSEEERSGQTMLFLPESGAIISDVQMDSLKFFAENQTLTKDKRWRIECSDYFNYKLIDTKTNQLVANLLFAEGNPNYDPYAAETIQISHIWAVTTPSGRFDASPEMMTSLHYAIGMEVIELDQLKGRYWEPGLLQKILGLTKGEFRNVNAFDNVPLYPLIDANIDKNQLLISLTERSGGFGKLSLSVNGKEMSADINPLRQKNLRVNLDEYTVHYRSDINNTIGLVAYNAGNWLPSQTYELPYRPVRGRGEGSSAKPSECGSEKPHLYLLMIGTSQYSDTTKNLTYPDLDAAEMAKALSSAGKALFEDRVHLKLLSTAGEGVEVSSKANIEKAFLEYKKATPCDVLVVYFSGHGSTWGKEADKTNFYYLTKDISSAKLADDAVRKEFAISDEDLTKWLAAIPAQKQVLILDACNSGKAAENLSGVGQRDLNPSQVIALELLKDRTGTFILTGSAADMVSFEASQYGQGLLTYSLLEGISGTALKDGKYLDIMTLFQNSRDVVPKLAASIKQVQIPVIAVPKGASSFPIGIKDGSVNIVLPQPKPIVIRCNFQDRDNFNDGLGLTQALSDFFHDQTVKGVQAKYVYFDIPKYAEGFAIRGNYAIKGELVKVSGRLFKGETPVGDAFEFTGSKDPVALRKLIMKEVESKISVK